MSGAGGAPGQSDYAAEEPRTNQLFGGRGYPSLPFPLPTAVNTKVDYVPTRLVVDGTVLSLYGKHLPTIGIPALGEPHVLDLNDDQTYRLTREKRLASEALTYRCAVSATAYTELGTLQLSRKLDELTELTKNLEDLSTNLAAVIRPEAEVLPALVVSDTVTQEQVDQRAATIQAAKESNAKRKLVLDAAEPANRQLLTVVDDVAAVHNTLHLANQIQAHQQEHLRRVLAPNYEVSQAYKDTLNHLLTEVPEQRQANDFFAQLDREYQISTIRGHFSRLEKAPAAPSTSTGGARQRRQRGGKAKAGKADSSGTQGDKPKTANV